MKKITALCLSALLLTFASVSLTGCSNGENGKDGSSIVWKGSLKQAPENPGYLWAYYNTSTKCSYVWDGTKWALLTGTEQSSFPVTVLASADIETKDVAFKTVKEDQVVEDGNPVNMIFKKSLPEVPYVPCTPAILKDLTDLDYKISDVTADTKTVTITAPNGEKALFDLTTRTCSFDNYDAFYQQGTGNNVPYLNPTGSLFDYMKITDNANTPGKKVAINWSTQNIGIVLAPYGNEYVLAIPLQSFDDFFSSAFIYNGKYIYSQDDMLNFRNLIADYYFGVEKKPTRSKEFADYCYNEFCLNLDINYGLKALHGIDKYPDFDTYFATIGIRDKLKSEDSLTFAKAVKDVCEFYFGDGHSNYILNSYTIGITEKVPATHTDAMDKAYQAASKKYIDARNNAFSGHEWADEQKTRRKAPGYQLSSDGKTAIVRFDSFVCGRKNKASLTEDRAALLANNRKILNDYTGFYEENYDTNAFISAVNELIQQNAQIENVVLDLSRNGGGAVQAAVTVMAWMLGEVTLNMENPNTGAKWFSTYQVDINFDGAYDDKDTVKNKNLFCLTSPISFSCGNTVPVLLKDSSNVTILGVTSGGGAAFVHNTSAADGTLFRCSSKYVVKSLKNGSQYNIDTGAVPDFTINKPANFYSIDKINSLVQSINEAKLGSLN